MSMTRDLVGFGGNAWLAKINMIEAAANKYLSLVTTPFTAHIAAVMNAKNPMRYFIKVRGAAPWHHQPFEDDRSM